MNISQSMIDHLLHDGATQLQGLMGYCWMQTQSDCVLMLCRRASSLTNKSLITR